MSLINIEYGSLASSETMNQNFAYLEERISDSNETIMTSISSILSNIATINARLSELSQTLEDDIYNLDTKLEGYKNKTKLLVSKANMIPDWLQATGITLSSTSVYTSPSNGYLLILPLSNGGGYIIINNQNYVLKQFNNSYDNASELMVIPVTAGDTVKLTVGIISAYFLPVRDISVENF